MLPELKPYLTALALPPASLLILMLLGAWLIRRRPKLARRVVVLSAVSLWALSTNAFSVWLHGQVIPEYPLITPSDLQRKSVQAIVVLGGGVVTGLPGDNQQLSKTSLERLRLGAQLARQSSLPLVFSGGSGWGAKEKSVSEADVAQKVLGSSFGLDLKFKESSSRDTQENAVNTWSLLSKNKITIIALITSSTHMPRSRAEFMKAGFVVTESAVGQPTLGGEGILSLIPSASSLEVSQSVLRELLAKLVQQIRSK
jgi:uncharacterized SAM-binding protein YcdF (DUF218 family)